MLIISLIGSPVVGAITSKIISKVISPSSGLFDSVFFPLMSRVSSRGTVFIVIFFLDVVQGRISKFRNSVFQNMSENRLASEESFCQSVVSGVSLI